MVRQTLLNNEPPRLKSPYHCTKDMTLIVEDSNIHEWIFQINSKNICELMIKAEQKLMTKIEMYKY